MGSLFFYFFYQSFLALPAGALCAFFFCRYERKRLCRARRQELERQFKDWLEMAASHLQAGYSVENAFIRAGRELNLLYDENADIRKEARSMEHLLTNNVPLERILSDLGERSGAEDICNFADVFAAGKRSGGDLREMIGNCCEMILMKQEVEREIRTLLHGKILEQRIMCLMPFGIVCYISVSSPGYFADLYHNPAGICIMSVCLLGYLFAVGLSLRIVRIEV